MNQSQKQTKKVRKTKIISKKLNQSIIKLEQISNQSNNQNMKQSFDDNYQPSLNSSQQQKQIRIRNINININRNKNKNKKKKKNQKKNQKESQLGISTKKFINLIKNQPDKKISINQAARRTGIAKRRIYQVIHILQSASLISSIKDHCVQWIQNKNYYQNFQKKDKQILDLQEQEKYLDQEINIINQEIQIIMQESKGKQQNPLFFLLKDIVKIQRQLIKDFSMKNNDLFLLSLTKNAILKYIQHSSQLNDNTKYVMQIQWDSNQIQQNQIKAYLFSSYEQLNYVFKRVSNEQFILQSQHAMQNKQNIVQK